MHVTRICAALLGATLALAVVASPAVALGAEATTASGIEWEKTAEEPAPHASALPSSDELFAGYVNSLFYGDEAQIEPLGITGYEQLSEKERTLYNILKAAVEQIAAGQRTETDGIELPEVTYTKAELGLTDDKYNVGNLSQEIVNEMGNIAAARYGQDYGVSRVSNALLDDLPYSFYWNDKTGGNDWHYSISFGGDDTVTVTGTKDFGVAVAYQLDGDAHRFDTSKVQATSNAAANAKTIVDKLAGSADIDKLVAYKNAICDLVSYNYSAATDTSTPYGDPWQLVWVFDDDSTTNVVCEGYAKAFQYLCDISTFKSNQIRCTTVSGILQDGNHMWNIVRLDDGKNYLADVTNSDEGTAGADGSRFLVPFGQSSDGTAEKPQKYTFGRVSTYTYGNEDYNLYSAEVLNLSSTAYAGFDDTNLANATVSTLSLPPVYNGQERELPSVTITLNGNTVPKNAYTLTYANNIDAGTASVTATANEGGGYTGSVTMFFTIEPKPLKPSLQGATTKVYDGTNASDGNGLSLVPAADDVVAGDEVSVVATNFRYVSANVGTGIAIHATGLRLEGDDRTNYTLGGTSGTIAMLTANVGTITPCSLSSELFDPIPRQTYTGSPVTPAITVSSKWEIPFTTSDYAVTYENNTSVGTGRAIITATEDGNYQGQVTLTFPIVENASTPDPTPVVPSNPGDIAIPVHTPGAYHATVTVVDPKPDPGDSVVFIPQVDEGYEIRSISVIDEAGNSIPVTQNEDGTWSFEQPETAVTIKVESGCNGGDHCLNHTFADLDNDIWYHDPIDWAIENDVLHGYADGSNTMRPTATISRVEMAAILWNYAGNPEPTGEVMFADCSKNDWYAQAVAWASEAGVFSGYEDGTFGPLNTLTREQAAVTLWRAAGEPVVEAGLSLYPDIDSVSPFARQAMAWAVSEGIISGREPQAGTKLLAPQGVCSRAEVAAVLMRYEFLEK